MGTKKTSKRILKISEPVSQNLLAKVKLLKNQGIEIHDFSQQYTFLPPINCIILGPGEMKFMGSGSGSFGRWKMAPK